MADNCRPAKVIGFMTKAILFTVAVCAAILSGCEKYVVEEEAGNNDNQEIPEKDYPSEDIPETDFLTVAEAQAAETGNVICVRGYIVASCTKSMSNADFMEPFEGSTAIILAEEPVDLEDFQYDTDDNLFPVCLTDYKDVRAALNLEDNPELWNRQIFITGVKSSYLRIPGLKKVMHYQIK